MRTPGVLLLLILASATGFHCGGAVNSAAALYIQAEDWTSAGELLRKEVADHPGNAQAWLMLGRVSKAQGNTTDAVQQLNQAVVLDSSLAREADAELSTLTALNEPPPREDFRTSFSDALRAENYLQADGIRVDWLDYLESTPEAELTNRGRRELDNLRGMTGLTDSLLIPWRRLLLSDLKAGKIAEARSMQEKITERIRTALGGRYPLSQASVALLRELTEAERADLSIIDLFLSR
jgi:tetratricopeptide (TPR) repeat protein